MNAWGEDQGAASAGIKMLSDKEAKLCRGLGAAKDADGSGLIRSERYAMVVKDGKISHWLPASQPDGETDSANTYAPSVLAVL